MKKYLITDLYTNHARTVGLAEVEEVLYGMFAGFDTGPAEWQEVIDAIESIGAGLRRNNRQVVGAAAAWLGVSVTVAEEATPDAH